VRGAPDDVAGLLYTSGTTGEPKGVVLSHANILANVLAVKDIVRATIDRPEEHRTLSFLPWAHAFGHTVELHGLISSGASLAIAESIDKVIDNIREVKPTVLVAVPTVFVRIQAGVEKMIAERSSFVRWLFRAGLEQAKIRRSGLPLSARGKLVLKSADRLIFSKIRARFGGRLRFAICGAAALPRETGEFVDSIGIDVFEGYGLTECSPIVSANTPHARKLGSAGRPLPGVRVVIEKSTKDGESRSGEIIVYGENVMRGYYRRDDENRRVLTADGGLRTGDLGYLDSDGFLFVTGRIKEQYKLLNAKYVAPAQLEEQLKLSPWIESVLVYGDNRPYNVALIVPNEKALQEFAQSAGLGDQSPAGLLEHPRVKLLFSREIERLSLDFKGYERIRDFVFVPEPFTQQNGLLTPSLKLRRAEILKRWGSLLEGLYANAPAISSDERLFESPTRRAI
jgi:long-chain acyl-CoA synthetase